jgi:hypothetical protein
MPSSLVAGREFEFMGSNWFYWTILLRSLTKDLLNLRLRYFIFIFLQLLPFTKFPTDWGEGEGISGVES